jgi:heme o synthase
MEGFTVSTIQKRSLSQPLFKEKIALSVLLKLTRFYLSMAVSFSSLAGFILYSKSFTWTALYAFLGVLFLSGAASALNQYQERHLDARMKRTQNRPLPSGQISSRVAIIIAILLGITGALLLYFLSTPMTAYLGLFNMLWYNAVYTPLKKRTSYAVLIGAVTGSIPPLMGWTAAGGSIFSPQFIIFAFFMFLWQIPHFWLLLMKFGKEYETAGFPSVVSSISDVNVKIIVFIWIICTSVSTFFFPLFHVISNGYLIGTLILLNVFLITFFYRSITSENIFFNTKSAFRSLYLFQIMVLILLMIQALH